MSIEHDMGSAADEAARFGAGKVLGDAIAKAHPGLPPLRWSATKMNGTWYAGGQVTVDDDAETRRIVEVYAAALGADSEPRKVEREGEIGWELETSTTFEGIEVTVWGVLLDL